MKFQDNIMLIGVADKEFTNKNGEVIAYFKATLVTSGQDVMSVSTTPEVLDSVDGKGNIEGTGEFEVSVDFNHNPKLKLVGFRVGK